MISVKSVIMYKRISVDLNAEDDLRVVICCQDIFREYNLMMIRFKCIVTVTVTGTLSKGIP